MKNLLLPLLTGALAVHAVTVKQDVFETFAASDYGNVTQECTELYNCTTKPLPFPGDGVKWNNLYPYRTPIDLRQETLPVDPGLTGPDGFLEDHDVYLALWKDTSKPATVTSMYTGTRVKYFELHAIGFGCTALQNDTAIHDQLGAAIPPGPLTLYANCSLTVEGLDHKDQCVGSETFEYVGVWYQWSVMPAVYLVPVGVFKTTAGGLKGKKVASLKLTPKYEAGPGAYVGPTVYGIDQVQYTLYNRTT